MYLHIDLDIDIAIDIVMNDILTLTVTTDASAEVQAMMDKRKKANVTNGAFVGHIPQDDNLAI
jgi:hypothetical protein